ncbi:MAG: hypothetical protein ACOYA9_12185 [Bilifractor sp.]|jgi:hypothetical protein
MKKEFVEPEIDVILLDSEINTEYDGGLWAGGSGETTTGND